jgi:NADH:ubiquinone oxidoreductase subunit 3 (subunit A)
VDEMMQILFSPPVAFLIYLALVGLLSLFGKKMAGPSTYNRVKSSTYSSGEAAPNSSGVPGYRPFFVVALFFAVLHLGVLVLGTGFSSVTSVIYLVGLMLALLALILG